MRPHWPTSRDTEPLPGGAPPPQRPSPAAGLSKSERPLSGAAAAAATGAAVVEHLDSNGSTGTAKTGKSAAPVGLSPDQFAGLSPDALPHAQPAADGGSFQLVLIRAMVAAAKADGHVDATEQQKLFGEVERLGLDSEAKAQVFDLLSQPVDMGSITGAVATPEQGAEVYLASRLAIDVDVPAERAYLDALATRLKLPAELRTHLDAQAGPAA